MSTFIHPARSFTATRVLPVGDLRINTISYMFRGGGWGRGGEGGRGKREEGAVEVSFDWCRSCSNSFAKCNSIN